jgi:tartrate-resistant acid phosphatase type 5
MMIRSSIWLSTTLCAVYGHSLSFLWTSNIASVATSPHIGVAQYAVSIGMQLVATALDVAFIVSLGDNFLPDGVSSVSDPRFIESWQNVYISSGPHRALNVPWFVIAGVADYYGNVTAEIEFSNISEYWDFPDLYYAKSFNLSNCSMDMIFIDTTNLTLTEPNASNVQLEWIEEMLSNSTADYLVVLGNLPVFSVCESGNSPFLVERLHPLLRRHGAVYMSGHDQCAEHIVKDTVHYFVNGVGGGLGGRAVNIHNVFVDQLLFLLSESHVVSTSSNAYNETYGVFGSVEVFCGAMTVSFFTQSGHRMYSSHISSRYYFNDDNSTYIGTEEPSADPTVFSPPTVEPTALSTFEPTIIDIATASPTLKPTIEATKTSSPTFLFEPTAFPTFSLPTAEPTVSLAPTFQPLPTAAPTPTFSPTISKIPTAFPSPKPTVEPLPTFQPTVTVAPTISLSPTRGTPSLTPTIGVTNEPSFEPTPVIHITAVPTTAMPTYYHPPTFTPTYTFKPTLQHIPTYEPSGELK